MDSAKDLEEKEEEMSYSKIFFNQNFWNFFLGNLKRQCPT